VSNSSRRSDDQVYRVVVVDDHEMILESIVRLLAADRGSTSSHALTGIEGIESVRDQSPDVLVIDYHLPDMDAPEAIAQFATLTETSRSSRSPDRNVPERNSHR